MNRTLRIAAVAAVAGGSLVAASAAHGATTANGASFPQVAYQQWCGESGLCSYAGGGSSTGIRSMIAKSVDWAGTDATLTDEQLAQLGGTVKYFPTLLGAITVPVNIPGVVGRKLNLDGKTLGDIFAGAVTTWNNRAITKANKGLRLPASPITLCVRSDGSGTSFGFSRYLTKVSPTFAKTVNFSQTPPWKGTISRAPQNPGVLNCVKNTPNSIGYVDLADVLRGSYYDNVANIGKSEVVKRKRQTVYVRPTTKSISLAGNMKSLKPDLTIDFSASPAVGAYPITVTTWVIAVPGRPKNAEVKQVLNYFYGAKAQGQLQSVGFAPLPQAVRKAGIRAAAALR